MPLVQCLAAVRGFAQPNPTSASRSNRVDPSESATVGVEYHAFEHGEPAFGVGRPDTPSAAWPALYDAWSRG
jgi:hypothetical protein